MRCFSIITEERFPQGILINLCLEFCSSVITEGFSPFKETQADTCWSSICFEQEDKICAITFVWTKRFLLKNLLA